MTVEQAPAPSSRRWPGVLRLVLVALVAAGVVRGLSTWMRYDGQRTEPAGFGRGVLHGAAMPLAWPGLLAGHDAVIYAEFNTGRTYKLGYTSGVNLCGALFFGLMYRRVSRLRALVRARPSARQ
jgi:hypothetical protein